MKARLDFMTIALDYIDFFGKLRPVIKLSLVVLLIMKIPGEYYHFCFFVLQSRS